MCIPGTLGITALHRRCTFDSEDVWQILSVLDTSSSLTSESNLVGVFLSIFAGQILYGRVLWNPEQSLHSAYKLQLEKVYLCTGKDGYVPFFDPTGTIYNEGPQYGCIQPNRHLKHRFLLLVGSLSLLMPRSHSEPMSRLCIPIRAQRFLCISFYCFLSLISHLAHDQFTGYGGLHDIPGKGKSKPVFLQVWSKAEWPSHSF